MVLKVFLARRILRFGIVSSKIFKMQADHHPLASQTDYCSGWFNRALLGADEAVLVKNSITAL